MVDAVSQDIDIAGAPTWSPREVELLEVTLALLQENGYDRLTVDAVAAAARASKATVYRRWPSKAELVLAAFTEGIRQVAVPPDTGTLRGDLLRLGELVCQQVAQHAGTLRAVLVEVSRNPALNEVMQSNFVDQRKALVLHILGQAVDRGEIGADAIDDDLWDVLPGYLIFRSLVSGRMPTAHTVADLVDQVVLPGGALLNRTVRYRTLNFIRAAHRYREASGEETVAFPPGPARVDGSGGGRGSRRRGVLRIPTARHLRLG